VFSASRYCLGRFDFRDRLRRQQLVTFSVTVTVTVTGAITHARIGRAVIVCRDSCGRLVPRE
jgi:hypothetical protein